MKILHLFSGYNNFTVEAHKRNHEVISLDIKNYKSCVRSTITQDFLEFDYEQFKPGHFDFILVGFPCTTFSKASGGLHFENNIPKTVKAHNSILMITRLHEILNYFKCYWIIENPTSALFSNKYFLDTFLVTSLNLIRCHQFLYGHITAKQTDLLTNKNVLWLDNRIYRVNGKIAKRKFSNLSIKQKQSYPNEFCNKILDFIEL
jgi:site-specific DNA-cytosine methylase